MITRSELMSRIKSKGNKSTELAMARLLRRHGCVGWRRNQEVLGINVDFVFKRLKVALFVDGCFWHKCREHCKAERLSAYWYHKVDGNMRRDWFQTHKLETAGWKVIRLWEHDLKGVSL